MGRAVFPQYGSGNPELAANKPLTVKQLRKYPHEAFKLEVPKPTSEGHAKIAKGRDGPFNLRYLLYGHGPTRILWISGHAAGLEDWYEIVKKFGVQNSDKYTSLVYENRGIGKSQAPWSIWSMKSMASDAKDLLDHVQWTGENSVHVVGHSMGGMTALEFAIANSALVASLTLLSTTSHFLRDRSLYTLITSSLNPQLLLSADTRLTAIKNQTFGQQWLQAPDPTGTFPTNGDAWAARFLTWPVHYKGAIMQAPAGLRHRVDAKDLKTVAEKLGPGRVAIVHGWSDQMIPVAAAERMWEEFGGKETGVKITVMDGVGHMPHFERLEDVIALVDAVINGRRGSSVVASHDRAEEAGH